MAKIIDVKSKPRELRRGDIVTVALPGEYGKPRPALVVQSELFRKIPSVTLLPLTSDLRATETIRITVRPSKQNNLRDLSQVMIDKIHTVSREKIGETFGHLETRTMMQVTRLLAVFLGMG